MRRSPGRGREETQGLDGAGRGLLGGVELTGACEGSLAVGALQADAAAHAGDGVDDQADLHVHGSITTVEDAPRRARR